MKYVRAQTAVDALQSLLGENGKAMILAGGSDLMIKIQEGKIAPEVLVDVTFAPDMQGITVEGNELVIYAGTTLTEIARSPVLKKFYPSLCKAAGGIGTLQIRNSSTLVGNIVTALPAADTAIALTPLAPKFIVLSATGTKTFSIDELYVGFGKSLIDPSKEIVTEVRIPLPAPGEAASYIRLELRKSLSLPMLNVGAMLNYSGGEIQWARIAMGPVGSSPTRAKEAEEFLAGKALSRENAAKAGELALKNAKLRSNPLRGSKEYREQVLPILVRRALEDIAAQLGVNEEGK